jgi:hypothetical protein
MLSEGKGMKDKQKERENVVFRAPTFCLFS